MRILIYGFGPYRQFRENITARIIKSLTPNSGVRKVIFPVRFHRRQFIDVLRRHKPDIVLGLGQSARKQIDVEMRAVNRRRAHKADRPRPIFKDRPTSLPTTLAIRASRWARISKDAGDYVCNYSMFVFLDEISRKEMATRFGFIHIPHDYERRNASRMVEGILRQFTPSRRKR